jgi:hypothetical protein
MKIYGGYGSAILDLNLSTRLKSAVIFTAKTFYPLLSQKEPLLPAVYEVGWAPELE